METFDENAFATHHHMQVDAHVSAQNLESIKVHQPGIEAVWSTTTQLREAVELVVQEAWQESLLPREEERSDGTEDHGPPLDNSTIHWKPPDDGIVLLELFGGIGTGLAAILQAGIKVQRYVYVDTDDAARQVAKHHSRGLRVRFPELLATTAILSAFFFTYRRYFFNFREKSSLAWTRGFGDCRLALSRHVHGRESEWLARWSLFTILQHGSCYTLPPDFSTSTTRLHCGKCPRCE
jgi:hypothetical protein